MRFPILDRKVHGRRLAYLDSGASSQTPTEVLDAMRAFDEQSYSNVHRGIHTLAEEATERYEAARAKVAKFLNVQADEIVFTRSTTDGLNMLARMLTAECEPGDEIVLTIMEHHSNLVPWQQLADEHGLALKFIPLTPDYVLDMDAAREVITDRTRIVSVTHVSNVTGTVVPVRELARIAHSHDAVMVVDGAQAVAHMPLDMKKLDADYYVFSGHKMYGPTGIGVLYGRKELLDGLSPQSWGGSMVKEVKIEETTWNDVPWRFEPGTPNITQAVGLSAAIDAVEEVGWREIQERERSILTYALEQLRDVDGLTVIGPATPAGRGGVISFVLDGTHPHDVASVLDEEGVAVRAGHHCTQPLHCALGLDATVRATIAIHTTREDIDQLVRGLQKAREVLLATA